MLNESFRRLSHISGLSLAHSGAGFVASSKFKPRRRQDAGSPVELLEQRTLLTGLTIVPHFDSNITHDPKAAQIEAAINAAISQIDVNFSDSIKVPVEFQEGGGLGTSSTYFDIITYSQFRAALVKHATDANDTSAIASLPTVNPLNGSKMGDITLANELALGLTPSYTPPQFFSTITLNTSICNLTRTSVDPNKYDLQGVAEHELDEVLGIGSSLNGSTANGPLPSGDVRPEDLFRYGSNGKRAFTTNPNAAVFFSIDGGKTDLARFNQDPGGDYNDWYSVNGGVVAQVQDAFGDPGTIPNYNVEPTVLDVIGYTPTRTLGTGIVTGVVFNDANANGVLDKGEGNLSGWTVQAIQNGKVITSEASNVVKYQLGGLADGTYTIQVVPKTGFAQTTPVSTYTVTITGHNDTVSAKNFGETTKVVPPTATVSGVVFNDANGNGVQDHGEANLAGFTIDAVQNGKVVATATSTATGYTIAGLAVGSYTIQEVAKSGFTQTAPASTYSVTIATADQTITGKNFGDEPVAPPPGATISGVVFNDINGDGVQGAGENDLSGFTIKAILNGQAVATTTSTAAGYSFTGLGIGKYTIEEMPKAGYTLTAPETTTYTVTIIDVDQVEDEKDFGDKANVVVGGGIFPHAASIGNPTLAGSASFSNGVYTVKGAGRDIFGTSDQFEFDYTSVTGDMTIIANVASLTKTYAWAKAGVMIRASTAADSAFADVMQTPDHGVTFQWRSADGASSHFSVVPGYHAPQFVKLVRSGNVFSAYTLENTGKWLQIGTSQTIAMSSNALVGLAVTSVRPSEICTAAFTNVSLTTGNQGTIASQVLN